VFTLWIPAQNDLSEVTTSYETARHKLLQLRVGRGTLLSLIAAEQHLPSRNNFAAVVLVLSMSAEKEHVMIPGVDYSFEALKDTSVRKAVMTFKATGQYEAIRRFIYRLETSDSYLSIESLSVARAHQSGQVTFSLRVVTFVKPDTA